MVLLARDGAPSGRVCQCTQSDDGSRLCSTATGAPAPAWPSRGSQRRARSLHLRRGLFCVPATAHRCTCLCKCSQFPLDTSTSGGSKAISAAVIGQTSMNLSDSDGLVKNRDKITPKHVADAFTRILAGKLVPATHPFGRLNAPTQYDPTLFQHGRVFIEIWFHDSMNQPIKDN